MASTPSACRKRVPRARVLAALAISSISLVFVACASQGIYADRAFSRDPASSSVACADARTVAAQTRLKAGDVASAAPTVKFADAQSTRLVDVTRVMGPCAPALLAFRMSRLYFPGATLSMVGTSGRVEVAEGGPGMDGIVAMDRQATHPEGPSGQWIMGTLINAFGPNTKAGDYVGLWRDNTQSSVYAFTRSESGAFSVPRLVLTSNLPLHSISFFPSPDSPSGRLGLVQEADGGIRLLSVDWFHQAVFARKGES